MMERLDGPQCLDRWLGRGYESSPIGRANEHGNETICPRSSASHYRALLSPPDSWSSAKHTTASQRRQHALAQQAQALLLTQPVRRAELDPRRAGVVQLDRLLGHLAGRASECQPAQQCVGDVAGGQVEVVGRCRGVDPLQQCRVEPSV